MHFTLDNSNIFRRKAFWRLLIAFQFLLVADVSFAAKVTVDDWIDRLSVFYAVVAVMIIIDGFALYHILKALRQSSVD
jgi:hypothetical protein